MEPVGFGFEHYDGVGRFRSRDQGQEIDSSGRINGTDVAGPFDGAAGLATLIRTSAQARGCYVKQWFRYGLGRGETPDDRCALRKLENDFESHGHDIRGLVLGLTQSDAFRYRRARGGP